MGVWMNVQERERERESAKETVSDQRLNCFFARGGLEMFDEEIIGSDEAKSKFSSSPMDLNLIAYVLNLFH